MPLIPVLGRHGHEELSKSEIRPLHRASSRIARAMQRKPVLKNNNNNNNSNNI